MLIELASDIVVERDGGRWSITFEKGTKANYHDRRLASGLILHVVDLYWRCGEIIRHTEMLRPGVNPKWL